MHGSDDIDKWHGAECVNYIWYKGGMVICLHAFVSSILLQGIMQHVQYRLECSITIPQLTIKSVII